VTVEVRIRAKARADIDRAARWHETKRRGLGREFLKEVEAAFTRIAENPKPYAELHRSIRRALLRRFPFGVFYHLSGGIAVVVAVMHSSRDPNEWQARTYHALRPTVKFPAVFIRGEASCIKTLR
jgi:plasmid stabilization system protein ParE